MIALTRLYTQVPVELFLVYVGAYLHGFALTVVGLYCAVRWLRQDVKDERATAWERYRQSRLFAATILVVLVLSIAIIDADEALVRQDLDCERIPWFLRIIEPACW